MEAFWTTAFDIDKFENACVSLPRSSPGIRHVVEFQAMRGSWTFQTSNRSDTRSINLASHTWITFKNASRQIALFRPGDFVLISGALYNPNHCLQDTLFSLLPFAFIGALSSTTALLSRGSENSYCTKVIGALGWFNRLNSSVGRDRQCFSKLYVPAFMHHRLPVLGMGRGVGYLPFGGTRAAYLGRSGSARNGYLHETDLPVEQLKWLRRQILHSVATPVSNVSSRLARVLFIARSNVSRRRWENIESIFEAVVQNLSHGVTARLIPILETLPVGEQLRLFHAADVVVMSHGAESANSIAMRTKTTLVEASCKATSWAAGFLGGLGVRAVRLRADNPPCVGRNQLSHPFSMKASTILAAVCLADGRLCSH